MEDLRNKIDEIDNKLLLLLKERFDVTKSVAEIKKKDSSIPLFDANREKEIINNLKSKKLIDDVIINEVWKEILFLSRCVQKDIINEFFKNN